ncbi:glycosyltransferase family 1 protein [Pedobacter changchengzhani]|uniref:Glycosyltransferase family 1 protein n=1 Tax=Pedobacter changchengzhani TaxID=2529274 RepID=A0A4R5MIG0_9SPHI|nr:glycosyltransferase family 4 protein [Pedobacter changchengzhani]TDG35311.1 glycosyltransferase family 1 protein [Pedobacter changchengzhani]
MLLLTLKTFSSTGGIEKVSRTLAKVLYDHHHPSNGVKETTFEMVSLCDKNENLDSRYCTPDKFSGFGGNKILFGVSAFAKGLHHEVILLSHINLLFIAMLIKFFKPKKRIILLAHGIEVWRELRNWKKKFIQKNVEIWAVSHHTANILINTHNIDRKSIHVLNNCLDPYFKLPTKFEKPAYLLERHQINNQQPVLLTVTRLCSSELYKGYDMVIETLKDLLISFPNLKYLLAGKYDVKEKARITKMISRDGLEKHVSLVSFIPDDELSDYFLLADLFIMPSKKEGFGIVFIEATACGCPVIAGNQDGSTDALLNGDLGLLINPESSSELISAIEKSLTKGKSHALSIVLQQKCLANFSYKAYLDKVLALLRSGTPK